MRKAGLIIKNNPDKFIHLKPYNNLKKITFNE
jgi:hypothetical protein